MLCPKRSRGRRLGHGRRRGGGLPGLRSHDDQSPVRGLLPGSLAAEGERGASFREKREENRSQVHEAKHGDAPAPNTPANAQGVRRRGAGGDEIGHRHRNLPQKNRWKR